MVRSEDGSRPSAGRTAPFAIPPISARPAMVCSSSPTGRTRGCRCSRLARSHRAVASVRPVLVSLPLLFFASGFASLVYEVTWVRSLTLVFGGSHLAVTTVLSVFMGGLALGGVLLGSRADRARHPLRLYAALEIGIALSAAAFSFLLWLY